MTSRVWIVTCLPLVFAAVSEVPTPTHLALTSRNLQHLLTWEPGPGTPPGAVYRVTKRTDRDVEAVVRDCERVLQPLTCNLTEALQKDPFDSYSIRVKAVMGNQTSLAAEISKFKPVEHLDLPWVSIMPCGRNLCVELQPPHSSLASIYSQIRYQLQIKDSSKPREPILKDKDTMEREVLEHLSSGRQYCVSIRFAHRLENIVSNFSQPVCAHTPGIFTAEPLVSVLVCLLLTAAAVLVGLFVWTRLTCLEFSKFPSILTNIHHLEEVLIQSFTESVSSLSNARAAAQPGGPKALALSSSEDEEDEEDEEESITDSTGASSQEGYKGRGDSSSLPSSSRLRPPPTVCPDPPCRKQAQETTDPRSRTEPSGSTAGVGTDENKLLEGEEGAQEVNLLTVTFSQELEEQQEDHLLSLCFSGPLEEGAGPENDLSGGVTTALPAESQPPQQELVKEVEDDDSSGYMCRPQHSV